MKKFFHWLGHYTSPPYFDYAVRYDAETHKWHCKICGRVEP